MRYLLKGLDCPQCAQKIERTLNRLEGVKFSRESWPLCFVELQEDRLEEVKRRIDEIEKGIELLPTTSSGSSKQSKQIIGKQVLVILASILFFFLGLWFRLKAHRIEFCEYFFFLVAYLMAGHPVLGKALKNIRSLKIFDENFLMTVATLGAIAIHELPEAVAVMIFYQVGEFFQGIAVDRSRRSITELLDIRAEFARLIQQGKEKILPPEQVPVGSVIEVRPGERVPLDGKVIEGEAFVDTSSLTGESVPRKIKTGCEILSGMVNQSGVLKIEVTRPLSESAVSRILNLVENAATHKAPKEQFITRFARYYTPLILTIAFFVAVLPPLLIETAVWRDWVYRALVLLVISCPCALVVSIPISYFGGLGAFSKRGILVKGAQYLDGLLKVKVVAFDKTGTLTEGQFRVLEVVNRNHFTREELLEWAALCEYHSNHPIAQSIKEAWKGNLDRELIENYEEIRGLGVRARVKGKEVLVGRDRLLHKFDIPHQDCELSETVVYVVVEGKYAGYLILGDQIKEEARTALFALKQQGIQKFVMLTGDQESVAKRVADAVGIDEVYAELLPDEKVEKLKELKNKLSSSEKLMFVGDGLNDAPSLMIADIGVAMGGMGSDAAIESADLVIMDDHLQKLPLSLKLARFTHRVVWENIVLALGAKGFFVVLGSMGMATMWEAVFADMGVALLAIFNALRIVFSTKV